MRKALIFCVILFHGFSVQLNAQSIVTTKHNLSVSGPGTVKATGETEICIFCHAPHNSRPLAPLWNRSDPGLNYTLYTSSTLQALPGQPDGSSLLCLSCHDGTVALGSVISRTTPITMATGTFIPAGITNLSTNLRYDHPISFDYTSALATSDGQLKDPVNITAPVSLKNGRMQCTSCHDPHKDVYSSNFLVTPSPNSNLCNSCHQRTYWTASTHNTSAKTWNGTLSNPWPFTYPAMTTVAQNGCESCHNPHNSGGNVLNLKYQAEESNCMDCHNGNVAAKNIATQLAKTYKHNVAGYIGVHDANEPSKVTSMHVECVDCHNPHASNAATATAPAVNGFLAGVKGVDQSGAAVSTAANSYEICYRCHAGSSGSAPSSTARVISQNNTQLEFASGNPSFHPVAVARNNTEVTTNLIAPNSASTIIYCTSCHASDGAGAPAGPHGSIYPQILKLQYITTDGARSSNGTVESAAAYALCYSCHNRTNILASSASNTFSYHSLHIVSQRAPCNTCHDPHGISSTQGTAANNSNLINFRTGIVTPSSGGIIRFTDTGLRHGSCTLTCHGQDHNPKTY